MNIDNTIKTYCNHHGYSDINPYEVVRVISPKTVEIRRMKAEKDPTWKPEFVAGGFCAHCTNQSEQRWTYEQDLEAPVIRARLNKKGYWKSVCGDHLMSDEPRRYYDYNF